MHMHALKPVGAGGGVVKGLGNKGGSEYHWQIISGSLSLRVPLHPAPPEKTGREGGLRCLTQSIHFPGTGCPPLKEKKSTETLAAPHVHTHTDTETDTFTQTYKYPKHPHTYTQILLVLNTLLHQGTDSRKYIHIPCRVHTDTNVIINCGGGGGRGRCKCGQGSWKQEREFYRQIISRPTRSSSDIISTPDPAPCTPTS